jgi:hypothetical protein
MSIIKFKKAERWYRAPAYERQAGEWVYPFAVSVDTHLGCRGGLAIWDEHRVSVLDDDEFVVSGWGALDIQRAKPSDCKVTFEVAGSDYEFTKIEVYGRSLRLRDDEGHALIIDDDDLVRVNVPNDWRMKQLETPKAPKATLDARMVNDTIRYAVQYLAKANALDMDCERVIEAVELLKTLADIDDLLPTRLDDLPF